MPLQTLVLASASPRRRDLLPQIGIDPIIVSSDAEELHDANLTGRELCLINAYRKAKAVSHTYPDHSILAADTLVHLGTSLYGKPRDHNEAVQMLTELSDQTHLVVTGVCLMHAQERRKKLFADTTLVTFHPLTREEIELYLSKINPLDKAGGYAIQDHGEMIVKRIEGSYSNVVGLPLERLAQVWKDWLNGM